jgi:hypothetical protein
MLRRALPAAGIACMYVRLFGWLGREGGSVAEGGVGSCLARAMLARCSYGPMELVPWS